MKINKHKILACICLLLISAMLFVGCTSNANVNDGDDSKAQETSTEANTTESKADETEKIQLDAFSGLKISFSGISPRCTVSIDNSECSSEVRSTVTYSTDKQFYANQETVTVTASLTTQQAKDTYTLKSETMLYAVLGMPEYYSANSTASTDIIVSELQDLVYSEVGKMHQSNKLFGIGGQSNVWHYSKVESIASTKGYVLTLKDIKSDALGTQNASFYNSVRIIADCVAYTVQNNTTYSGHIYVCFVLNDVVVSTDGKISWANNTYDISYTANANTDTVTSSSVLSMSVYYDVEETEKTDWIPEGSYSN